MSGAPVARVGSHPMAGRCVEVSAGRRASATGSDARVEGAHQRRLDPERPQRTLWTAGQYPLMTVSRRTVVQGTAWSIPAVTIAAASPSGTASNTARSPESRATIDRAFPDLLTKQGSLTVNFYQLVLSANGFEGESWLNLRNDSDVPLRFTADHPLAPRVDVVGRTGPKDTERAGTGRPPRGAPSRAVASTRRREPAPTPGRSSALSTLAARATTRRTCDSTDRTASSSAAASRTRSASPR